MSHFGKVLKGAKSIYIPKVIGEVYGGGYFAGFFRGNGQRYAVVCAGIGGEFQGRLEANNKSTTGSQSLWDAVQNQADLLANDGGLSTYEIAVACSNYRGGGFDDWKVPAYVQSVMCYIAFKPDTTSNSVNGGSAAIPYIEPTISAYTANNPTQTIVNNFKIQAADSFATLNYHTSTLISNNMNKVISFSNGTEVNAGLNNNRLVRAIRMVKIPG